MTKLKDNINDNIITEHALLSLGFEKTSVSKEESGGEPYHYFVYRIIDKHNEVVTILISCANNECNIENQYKIELFDYESIGYIENLHILDSLIKTLKNFKK